MKTTRPKYTISICRSRNGQFFWRVRARNSRKVGTPGEPNKKKSHVIKMAIDLFLQGHGMDIHNSAEYPFGYWFNGDDCRLLEDLTKKTR